MPKNKDSSRTGGDLFETESVRLMEALCADKSEIGRPLFLMSCLVRPGGAQIVCMDATDGRDAHEYGVALAVLQKIGATAMSAPEADFLHEASRCIRAALDARHLSDTVRH